MSTNANGPAVNYISTEFGVDSSPFLSESKQTDKQDRQTNLDLDTTDNFTHASVATGVIIYEHIILQINNVSTKLLIQRKQERYALTFHWCK